MIDIPMRTKGALDRDTLLSINTLKTGQVYSAQNINELNRGLVREGRSGVSGRSPDTGASGRGPAWETVPGAPGRNSAREAAQGMQDRSPVRGTVTGASGRSPAQEAPAQMRIPSLVHPLQKGQKVPLFSAGPVRPVDVCLGWNSIDARCDVDVSAFLLGESGKVPGDDWFVFYGQAKSPDGSTVFEVDGVTDREVIRIDPAGMDARVKKVVFVLTINEAVEKRLNFGMLKDAYIRILDHGDQKELVSFAMTDYYTNVISMMIGELYLHNGNWKFHGIGNGVAKDLAGLCGLYGVQVS